MEKVKIRIRASQEIRYDQTVEIPLSEWGEIRQTPERVMEDEHMSPIISLIDFNNVLESRGFSDVEIDVVDDDDKFVKPYQYWDPQC